MTITIIERLQYKTNATVNERYGTRTLRYTDATVQLNATVHYERYSHRLR